jgi:primase-polymerase (primpol)-like protein
MVRQVQAGGSVSPLRALWQGYREDAERSDRRPAAKEEMITELPPSVESAIMEFSKRLAPIYQENRWRWHKKYIPTAEQIVNTIRYLLLETVNYGNGHTATGRLKAAKSDDGQYVVSLNEKKYNERITISL